VSHQTDTADTLRVRRSVNERPGHSFVRVCVCVCLCLSAARWPPHTERDDQPSLCQLTNKAETVSTPTHDAHDRRTKPASLSFSPSHRHIHNSSNRQTERHTEAMQCDAHIGPSAGVSVCLSTWDHHSSASPFPRPPPCAHLCRRPATLKLQHRSRADALALRGGELDAHRERGGHTRGKSTHGTDTRHDREVSLSLIHSTGGELSVALGGFVSVCPALSLSLSLRQVICVCVSACLSVSRPCVTDASTRDQHTLASRHHTPPSDRQTATATPHSDSFVQPASQSSLSVCLSVCHLSPPPTHRPTHSWQQTADKCQSKET